MPWKECSVMEERLRFVAKLLEGEAMTDVFREFGISRQTGYRARDRLDLGQIGSSSSQREIAKLRACYQRIDRLDLISSPVSFTHLAMPPERRQIILPSRCSFCPFADRSSCLSLRCLCPAE